MSTFRLLALPSAPFAPLFSLSDADLATLGARRCIATETPGFPCRVSLEDAEVGEEVLILHFTHHDVDSPYRASGPIYVRRGARQRHLAPGELPPYVTRRVISLRAYDAGGMMLGADVCEGSALREALERLLADSRVSYVHLHNAKPGCFSVTVERA